MGLSNSPYESLTRRENDILLLLSQNLTDREIAERLVLSLHSVKWYTRQIYGKLGVENRRQAVARSRELNLMGEPSTRSKLSNNLPRQLTSFVGREKEIDQVIELVREHPLVTLTGAGGVGKTRLALEAANRLLDDFPDGVWWIDLSQVIVPIFVPITIASVFSLHSATGELLVHTLCQYFAAKKLLLILDNCEHVIDAVARLSINLLERCPKLSILATSREILNVEGEYFFRCPSLSIPDTVPEYSSKWMLKLALGSEATSLFANRANTALPNFRLTEENAAEVIEICRRLDGIPLAIEMAAARLRTFGLSEIVHHMNDVFGLISGGRRSAPPRHKTVKAMIEWSYQLLSPLEQILLRRVSVFAGGWTLSSAEGVSGGDGVETVDVLNGMQQLTDKSLIYVEPTEFGENRYRMLETIRQYAGEKLHEAEEYNMVRDRHLEYFAHMVDWEDASYSNIVISANDAKQLMMDFDNGRQALAWSLETNNIEPGLRICLTWANVIPFHLYFEIGVWLEKLLETNAAWQDRLGDPRNTAHMDFLRGVALLYIGESSYLWGQRSRSEKALQLGIAILESVGEQADYWLAIGQMHMGCLLICTDPEQSRMYLEGGRSVFTRMNVKNALSSCDRIMVAMYLLTGNFIQARAMAEEDIRLNRDLFGMVSPPPFEYAGCVAFCSGNYDQAIEYFHQGMESGIEINSPHQAAYLGWMEGCAALAQGKGDHLLRLCEQMLIMGQETGISGWFFHTDALLAMLEWTQGKYDQAVKRSEEGLERYYPNNLSYTIAFPYVLGRIMLARGELAQAEHYFRQMDEMANAPPLWRWKPVSLHAFALLSASQTSQRIHMAERAALLFGAQEKLFGWLPNVLSPFERDEYARALTTVQGILGEGAFGAAWEKGQAMSYQQAFALALQETGESLV